MRKLLKVMSVFALVVLVGLSMAACGGNSTPSLEYKLQGLYVNAENNGEFYYFYANEYTKGRVYYSETYDEYILSTHCADADNKMGTLGKYEYNEEYKGWGVLGLNDEKEFYKTNFITEKNSNTFAGTIYSQGEKYTEKPGWSLIDFAINYCYETYGVSLEKEDFSVTEPRLQEYWGL